MASKERKSNSDRKRLKLEKKRRKLVKKLRKIEDLLKPKPRATRAPARRAPKRSMPKAKPASKTIAKTKQVAAKAKKARSPVRPNSHETFPDAAVHASHAAPE